MQKNTIQMKPNENLAKEQTTDDSAVEKSKPATPANGAANVKIQQLKAEAAAPTIDYEVKARKRRKKRAIRLVQKVFIFVIAPTLTAAIYFGHFAHDQFMSVAGVSVHSEGKAHIGVDSILGSFASTGSSQEAVTVQEYILSRDMLSILDKKTEFLSHYKNPKIDYLARLPKDATFEESYEYYTKMVSAVYDPESGVLTIEVKAFDAKSANRFAREIIAIAEKKVNTMSTKMQKDKINFTKGVVAEAEKRWKDAQHQVKEVQRKYNKFSPEREIGRLMGVENQLENALVLAKTELSQARAIMSPSAPKVQALARRVSTLQAQIKKEGQKLLNPEAEDEGGLAQAMADFEMAMLEKELAQQEYQSALVSLETARLDAMRQSRYLIEISAPSLPDEATYPKRIYKVATVFLVSLAAFGILSLMFAAVKEHARI